MGNYICCNCHTRAAIAFRCTQCNKSQCINCFTKMERMLHDYIRGNTNLLKKYLPIEICQIIALYLCKPELNGIRFSDEYLPLCPIPECNRHNKYLSKYIENIENDFQSK